MPVGHEHGCLSVSFSHWAGSPFRHALLLLLLLLFSSQRFREKFATEIFFVELVWLEVVYINRPGGGSPVEPVRKG